MEKKIIEACLDARAPHSITPTQLPRRIDRQARSSVVREEAPTELQVLERCELLEQQLAASNEQLKANQEDQQRTAKAMQEFVNTVSHDLQTPLRAISGFSQFLKEEYQEQLDCTANDYVDRVVDGAARMEQLIKGLVIYSRVATKTAAFEMVCLKEIVEEVLEKLRDQIDDAGAAVTANPLPAVWGDRAQLTLLMQNLIDNCLKFRSSSKATVHISAEKTSRDWTIAVKDNGIGVHKDHHECVFEIFRRLHSQPAHLGAGAGLAICRRIVDRHSGKIWLRSDDEAGCTFCFTIPLALN